MHKSHTFFSVFWSAAFLIMLQEFSVPRPVFRYLVAGFLSFSLAITVYNRWYLEKTEKYNVWTLVRPLLFFGSAFFLFQIIPADFLRSLFLLAAFILGFVFEYFLGVFAEGLLLNETLIIAFGFFMSACAYAFQYFPTFQTFYLAAFFFGTAFLTRAFFEFTPEESGKKMAAAVIIALFCTESFWALSFLPLHYSAAGLMLFNIFYFCLILQHYFIFNTLNIRKLQLHLLIVSLTSAVIFLITPWKVAVS